MYTSDLTCDQLQEFELVSLHLHLCVCVCVSLTPLPVCSHRDRKCLPASVCVATSTAQLHKQHDEMKASNKKIF